MDLLNYVLTHKDGHLLPHRVNNLTFKKNNWKFFITIAQTTGVHEAQIC